jgi:hypothetical protein
MVRNSTQCQTYQTDKNALNAIICRFAKTNYALIITENVRILRAKLTATERILTRLGGSTDIDKEHIKESDFARIKEIG